MKIDAKTGKTERENRSLRCGFRGGVDSQRKSLKTSLDRLDKSRKQCYIKKEGVNYLWIIKGENTMKRFIMLLILMGSTFSAGWCSFAPADTTTLSDSTTSLTSSTSEETTTTTTSETTTTTSGEVTTGISDTTSGLLSTTTQSTTVTTVQTTTVVTTETTAGTTTVTTTVPTTVTTTVPTTIPTTVPTTVPTTTESTIVTTTTVLEIPDTVTEILSQTDGTLVKVTGVVYYVIATPERPGYYVYDGTGTILVIDSNTVAVGDGVTLEASYDLDEPSPQLINVTSFAASTAFTTLPTYETISFADLVAHPSADLSFYGKTLLVTGIVGMSGPLYYLTDAGSTPWVIINGKSFVPSGYNPFADQVGSTVTIETVVHFFGTPDNQWQVLVANESAPLDFIPGEGGTLVPPVPSSGISNQFPGLYLTEVGNYLSMWYEGDPVAYHLVEMEFPYAAELEGTGYTLQYFDSVDTSWKAFQYNSADLTCGPAVNNFSIYVDSGLTLRLLLSGGPKDGYTSNEVTYSISAIPAEFSGYSVSWGMSLSGIMMPFVGYEIYDVSVSGYNWSSGSTVDVSTYITIEWYRVDPVTFQFTRIIGASGNAYATTEADAGYLIAVRGVGDGVNIEGYHQFLFQPAVKLMNIGYLTNATANGFTLNLFKAVSGLEVANFEINDQDSNPVQIASIVQGENGAIWHITFADSTVTTGYGVLYIDSGWAVAFKETMGPMTHYMEWTYVTLVITE